MQSNTNYNNGRRKSICQVIFYLLSGSVSCYDCQFESVFLHIYPGKIQMCTFLVQTSLGEKDRERGKNRSLYTTKYILYYGLLWAKREY